MYSAADVMIVPSLQENLSNAIMESIACGTPVVAYNIGGNSDMIVHKKSGYLAAKEDSFDLSSGIKWILNSDGNVLSDNCHNIVNSMFAEEIVSERYIQLYSKISNNE